MRGGGRKLTAFLLRKKTMMNDFAELLQAGEAELMHTLGEPATLRELPGSVEHAVTVVLSPVAVAYPVSLGGAVLECSATALLRREQVPAVRIGWRLVFPDARVYEVLRVESSAHDPSWHLELTRRK